MSDAYVRFRRGFLYPDSDDRRDGVPLEVLDELTATERSQAAAELLDALANDPSWIVPALGRLRSEPALPRLRELLVATGGNVRESQTYASIAVAIWQIARDPAMLEKLLVLSRQPYSKRYVTGQLDTSDMIHVVHCLAQLPHPEALARLEEMKATGDVVASNAEYVIGLRATTYADVRR